MNSPRKIYRVSVCERHEIKDFVEQNHYSKTMNGVNSTICFKLTFQDEIIGAAVFGRLGMANNWKKFASNPEAVLELRRLCCVDDTVRNAESYFIGKMLKYLKKHTNYEIVVSYADENENHKGTIYKASNFKYLGLSKGGKRIKFGDRVYHDKSPRTRDSYGNLKPFAVRLQKALDAGEATIYDIKGKHLYVYPLNNSIGHKKDVLDKI